MGGFLAQSNDEAQLIKPEICGVQTRSAKDDAYYRIGLTLATRPSSSLSNPILRCELGTQEILRVLFCSGRNQDIEALLHAKLQTQIH
ncbi:hypothetical protein L1049_006356 [Liquidambar formosana]|uniref:Uncharacterized protein n=1 Tax=Liquidambar formosana TaxID=63359 RepID=A0AAP0WU46_LIQFO